jgi:RsbRD-like negative regulator of sigma factor
MATEAAQLLGEALAARKGAIIRAWLAHTLLTYPEHTTRFLAHEPDPFRNPVGHTLKGALSALFDALLGDMTAETIMPLLDEIVRIRAVQDFTAAQAVAFVFLLKKVLREEIKDIIAGSPGANNLEFLEDRIDEMALLAFDLFMRCRERIYEVRVNETRRRLYLLKRMQERNLPVKDGGRGLPSKP